MTATVRVRFADGTIEDRPPQSPYFLLDPSRYPCTPNDAAWSPGDGSNPRAGWRMGAGWGGGLVGGPLRDAASEDPAEVRFSAFLWRITEDGGRWERAKVETFEEQIERTRPALEKATVLSRLAKAFEAAGGVRPDAPVLVLRMTEGGVEAARNADVLQGMLLALQNVCPVPVVLVPPGWTQEQIDAEAVRAAVLAEREACAALADEGIGWPGEAPAAARCIAANIRARGSK